MFSERVLQFSHWAIRYFARRKLIQLAVEQKAAMESTDPVPKPLVVGYPCDRRDLKHLIEALTRMKLGSLL